MLAKLIKIKKNFPLIPLIYAEKCGSFVGANLRNLREPIYFFPQISQIDAEKTTALFIPK
jgi:hypothetical protein